MPLKPADKLILERLYTYEDQITGHANALDAKSNTLIVAATFIATLAGVVMQAHPHIWTTILCLFGIAALVYAGIQSWNMLHMEDFQTEHAPNLTLWRDGIIQDNPGESDQVIEDLVCQGLSQGAIDRIEKNFAINKRRAALLESAYNATFLSLGFILASLIINLF